MHHLAAIQEWRGDRIQVLAVQMNKHLTEIDGDIQVVVPERVILFGVQNFQQCGRWISVKVVVSNLVDLIAAGGVSRLVQTCKLMPYRRMMGSGRPAFLRACTIEPGPLAT
jgi:hypothetical protein